MSTTALTITIPDWLLNGPFWLGFGCGVFLMLLVIIYCIKDFNPFSK